MKPTFRFKSAVSAVALSAAVVAPGAVIAQLGMVSVADAAAVSRIEVRGNQRVDAETVRSYLGIKPGQQFSNADIDSAVKRLFDTGLFSDVRINQAGGTLVVQVSEYQIVNQVLFQGNSKIKDEQLNQGVQTKPRSGYSQATVDADVEGIKAAYRQIGRDDATVTAQTVDLGENRVNVVFQIEEGDRTKIGSVNFTGNTAFPSRRLRDVLSTRESNFLSFLTRNDIYDADRLRADEEALRRFYYNRGYADFQVISSNAELDPATNEYTINFTVQEGERYTFGDVSIDSAIPGVDTESLRSSLETQPGATYSAKAVEDSIMALTERVAGSGYAFAQVTPQGDRDFTNRTISVVYAVDQGPRTYVERIEIRGNERTRDYVVRREFDVSEGDAFNQVLIQRAKRRLERLDFFQSVNISTAPGTQPDQVILVVDLVEKATGEFSIGGGYSTGGSTGGGPTAEGSISERNFLGRGQFIRVGIGAGRKTRDYNLSFTEPYFLGRRISAGFDIFRQTRDYDEYESEVDGGTIRFGLPITEALTTQVAYNLTREKYKYTDECEDDGVFDPDCDLAPQIITAIEEQSPWVKSSVSATLTYNTIDDPKNPHSGLFSTFAVEAAGLGGDAQWVKFTGRGSYYKTLSEEMDIVGLVSLGAGHIASYGEDLRVFDYFRATDRIVRGFEYDGFGPYDPLSGDHLGGSTYFNASAEAQFPLPILPQSLGLKGALFADAGTLYGNDLGGVAGSDMEWRASVGASLIWASPFGPLRVDYAVPVMKEDSDEEQNFNFGISSRF
jgi:outer membrane protein insertion porin family